VEENNVENLKEEFCQLAKLAGVLEEATLPKQQQKSSYDSYAKGAEKAVKEIQYALKVRIGRAKKNDDYDYKEMFNIMSDLQDAVKRIKGSK